MSQFRLDPISGRWVVIAPNRDRRPDEFARTEEFAHPTRAVADCPFCGGNEQETPQAIASYCDPDNPDSPWQVRVVPNKYPAVDSGGGDVLESSGSLFACRAGVGRQEVIIESRRHATSFSQLSELEARLTCRAYRDRLLAAAEDRRLAYAMIFKNVGPQAGASIEHSHSQLLGLSLVPPNIERELLNFQQHSNGEGKCLGCRIIEDELSSETRIVARTAHLVAYCPYAPRFPYEICVMPTAHATRFANCPDEHLDELALLVRRLVSRVETTAGSRQYNLMIHEAPPSAADEHYHWRLSLIPRLTRPAGLEWATDCFVNPVAPEEAAAVLRDASG